MGIESKWAKPPTNGGGQTATKSANDASKERCSFSYKSLAAPAIGILIFVKSRKPRIQGR